MNLICLDIDGCCNSSHTEEELVCKPFVYIGLDDIYLERLAYIIKYTKAKILLTSDWGALDPNGAHRKYLEEKFKQHNLSIDYIIDWSQYHREQRAKAIKDWISEHDVDRYVVIDDEYFYGYQDPEIEEHLFYCFDVKEIPAHFCGITENMKYRIIAYLLGCWGLKESYKDEDAVKYIKNKWSGMRD